MKNDPIDLPMRKTKVPGTSTAKQPTQELTTDPLSRPALTSQEFTSIIENTTKVAGGVLSIVKDIVEISRIQAQSNANVDDIRERSLAIERTMRVETERLLVERKGIRTRGEAAVSIINSVLGQIPESDQASRQLALEKLPELVKLAARSTSDSVPPQP